MAPTTGFRKYPLQNPQCCLHWLAFLMERAPLNLPVFGCQTLSLCSVLNRGEVQRVSLCEQVRQWLILIDGVPVQFCGPASFSALTDGTHLCYATLPLQPFFIMPHWLLQAGLLFWAHGLPGYTPLCVACGSPSKHKGRRGMLFLF